MTWVKCSEQLPHLDICTLAIHDWRIGFLYFSYDSTCGWMWMFKNGGCKRLFTPEELRESTMRWMEIPDFKEKANDLD